MAILNVFIFYFETIHHKLPPDICLVCDRANMNNFLLENGVVIRLYEIQGALPFTSKTSHKELCGFSISLSTSQGWKWKHCHSTTR